MDFQTVWGRFKLDNSSAAYRREQCLQKCRHFLLAAGVSAPPRSRSRSAEWQPSGVQYRMGIFGPWNRSVAENDELAQDEDTARCEAWRKREESNGWVIAKERPLGRGSGFRLAKPENTRRTRTNRGHPSISRNFQGLGDEFGSGDFVQFARHAWER